MGQIKAISPIIAIIIILLITIAIAGSAYSYISIYWTSTTGQNLVLKDAYSALGQVTLLINNMGTRKVTLSLVSITNSTGDEIIGTWTNLDDNAITELAPGEMAKFNTLCTGYCSYRVVYGSISTPIIFVRSGEAPEPWCTDSDGGLNYYMQGTTQNNTGLAIDITRIDLCSGMLVIEYYCTDEFVMNTNYDCTSESRVCMAGRCIVPP
jgi:type II secretory pathway pseudopilin PulG